MGLIPSKLINKTKKTFIESLIRSVNVLYICFKTHVNPSYKGTLALVCLPVRKN